MPSLEQPGQAPVGKDAAPCAPDIFAPRPASGPGLTYARAAGRLRARWQRTGPANPRRSADIFRLPDARPDAPRDARTGN